MRKTIVTALAFILLFGGVYAATNFPTNLDTFTDQTASDLITSAKWNNLQDAIGALEVKVGADSSAVTTSHDYKLAGLATTMGLVQDDITELATTLGVAQTSIDALEALSINTDITVTVGAAGDYTTINAALAALSAYYPLYVSGGFTAEISLLTGFEMAEQVLVSGIDLSWITITSVDAEVTIIRSALTVGVSVLGTTRYSSFSVNRGALPTIGVLFSMDSSGTAENRDGISVYGCGRAVILPGCGIKNASGIGLHCAESSCCMADAAVFNGCKYGVNATRCGQISFHSGTATGCTTAGIRAALSGCVLAAFANGQKGASPSTSDITVEGGGVITASNATGGVSQTANILTANGIIYQ